MAWRRARLARAPARRAVCMYRALLLRAAAAARHATPRRGRAAAVRTRAHCCGAPPSDWARRHCCRRARVLFARRRRPLASSAGRRRRCKRHAALETTSGRRECDTVRRAGRNGAGSRAPAPNGGARRAAPACARRFSRCSARSLCTLRARQQRARAGPCRRPLPRATYSAGGALLAACVARAPCARSPAVARANARVPLMRALRVRPRQRQRVFA